MVSTEGWTKTAASLRTALMNRLPQLEGTRSVTSAVEAAALLDALGTRPAIIFELAPVQFPAGHRDWDTLFDHPDPSPMTLKLLQISSGCSAFCLDRRAQFVGAHLRSACKAGTACQLARWHHSPSLAAAPWLVFDGASARLGSWPFLVLFCHSIRLPGYIEGDGRCQRHGERAAGIHCVIRAHTSPLRSGTHLQGSPSVTTSRALCAARAFTGPLWC